MCADLVPDSVDIRDLVLEEQFVAEPGHDVVDLRIAGCDEDAASLLDLILALAEVIVELVDELVRLIDSSDMPLTSTISLLLDHDAALLRSDHLHSEACALDLSLVHARCALLSRQDGLSNFLHVL